MSAKEILEIAWAAYPNLKPATQFNLTVVSALLGLTPESMRRFIVKHGVPHYRPEKRKMYDWVEVYRAYKKTRYAA